MSAQLERQLEIIEASGLFDRAWYLAEYPDVAALGLDPIEHYLRYGAGLLRNPSPSFDGRRYLLDTFGVADGSVNPLLHYLESRPQAASQPSPGRLSFAIKTAVPSAQVKSRWGDYHFARGLQRAFLRLGHRARVELRDAWEQQARDEEEIAVALRGRVAYPPKPGQINLMWNISHPADVTLAEYEGFDLVFVASTRYAAALAGRIRPPVRVLLQCTDPEIFRPDVAPIVPPPGVLFVGNSRQVYRRIVKDAIEAGLNPEIYGAHWDRFLPKNMIKSKNIPNDILAKYYKSCRCLLNDHWDDMREYGFLSNRLFDAVACGARVISDRVPGLEALFEGAVAVYDSKEELPELVRRLEQEGPARSELAERIRREHSFEARARVLADSARELLAQRRAGARGAA